MPSSEVVDTSSAFQITELSGDRRALVLTGRGLPYRPYTLKTKQRIDLTWYPGNPVATATVLGAAEEPTTIQGMWKDKFIGEPGAIVFAGNDVTNVRDAAGIVDELVRSGRPLEVTWDLTTRHGHLTSFEKSWTTTRDLQWSMTFDWISRGEGISPVVVVIDVALGDAVGTLRQLATDLNDATEAPFSTDPSFQETLRNAMDTIEERVAEMFALAEGLARTGLSPVDAVRRAISVANNLVIQLQELAFFLKLEVAAARNIFAERFQDKLNAEIYVRTLLSRTRDLRDVAIAHRAAFARQIQTELLGTHAVREGDDLRDLAQRYYGSPFEWRRIFLYNNLSTPALSRGQVLLIPRASVGTEVRAC